MFARCLLIIRAIIEKSKSVEKADDDNFACNLINKFQSSEKYSLNFKTRLLFLRFVVRFTCQIFTAVALSSSSLRTVCKDSRFSWSSKIQTSKFSLMLSFLICKEFYLSNCQHKVVEVINT